MRPLTDPSQQGTIELGDVARASKAHLRGTHRTCAPTETIARVEPLLGTFGITRVANLTGLDRIGIPVVMVCRPNARSSAVFHGKGIDIAAAKASGLMEAIETWHAEHIALPLRLSSFNELSTTSKVADVTRLPLVPTSRYHHDLPMMWIEGQDLISRGRVWVPFEVVHTNGTYPALPGSGCFATSTNGLASGNHFLEAVSHGLCEVIERDATSLWHRRTSADQDQTRLDLASVTDETCRSVLRRIKECGLEVAVWETTTDVAVPSFQCLLIDSSGEINHIGQGAGCHPMCEVALLRALTEAVQIRTTYIVGSREDIRHADYLPTTLAARADHVSTLMRPVENARSFDSCGRFMFEAIEDEVAWILGRLEMVGIRRAIAVDLTRPDLGISVARMVVPGLEGSDHHADYVPGQRVLAMQGRLA